MVRRDRQGESLGRLLLRYRLDAIHRDFGAIPVTIDTSQRTQGFYEGFGFIPLSVNKNAYGKGLDKVVMEYKGASRDNDADR